MYNEHTVVYKIQKPIVKYCKYIDVEFASLSERLFENLKHREIFNVLGDYFFF